MPIWPQTSVRAPLAAGSPECGAAGIGKTTLLESFAASVRKGRALQGGCEALRRRVRWDRSTTS